MLSFTALIRERSQVKVHRETHRACASSLQRRGASLRLHTAWRGQANLHLGSSITDRIDLSSIGTFASRASLRQFIHLRRAEVEPKRTDPRRTSRPDDEEDSSS